MKTISEKAAALVRRLSLIPEPFEKLEAIVARGQRWPEPPGSLRNAQSLVKGCESRLWVVCSFSENACAFFVASDTPFTKGLAALLCEIANGFEPEAILAEPMPDILDKLGLAEHISEKRKFGFSNVWFKVQECAGKFATPSQKGTNPSI